MNTFVKRLHDALPENERDAFAARWIEALGKVQPHERNGLDWRLDGVLCAATAGGTDTVSLNQALRVLREACALIESTGAGGDWV